MQVKSEFTTDAHPQASGLMQRFMIALVNEAINHPENLENSKKHLKKYCRHEQLSFAGLEQNLSQFLELIDNYRKTNAFILYRFLKLQAHYCFIDEQFGLLQINHPTPDDYVDESYSTVYCNETTESISSSLFGGIVGAHLIGL